MCETGNSLCEWNTRMRNITEIRRITGGEKSKFGVTPFPVCTHTHTHTHTDTRVYTSV